MSFRVLLKSCCRCWDVRLVDVGGGGGKVMTGRLMTVVCGGEGEKWMEDGQLMGRLLRVITRLEAK